MEITMLKALEIFSDPQNLVVKIHTSQAQRHSIAMSTGAERREECFFYQASFPTRAEAISSLSRILNDVVACCSYQIMDSHSLVGALLNPQQEQIASQNVLTNEIVDQILNDLLFAGEADTMPKASLEAGHES